MRLKNNIEGGCFLLINKLQLKMIAISMFRHIGVIQIWPSFQQCVGGADITCHC